MVAACLGGWWAYTRPAVPGLDDPAEMTLYSIDGRDCEPGAPPPTGETFHRYPVLGSVTLTDPAARAEVTVALRAGVEAKGVAAAACFWPRHGVRVVAHNRVVDYVICFECNQFAVHDGEVRRKWTTTREPQSLLNRHLTAAGVPLAPGMSPDEP